MTSPHVVQQEFVEKIHNSQPDGRAPAAMPEKEAIALAQQGDESAFERIYRLHSARVYALCLRMVGNTAEAEDLTQEAFLMVLRKIRSFRGESAFSTWLHRITVNIVLMRLRRKSWLETPIEESSEQSADRPALHEELATSDLVLAGSLDRVNLERALAQLRPFQKLVVVLHDIQGYKHTEIAKMMDWTIGNSKSRLHRARARLRSLLQDSLTMHCPQPSHLAEPAFSA
ncbi:MAG: sigma-70 family RNA polymerase sigma factor [Candidatus Acidiferrum sp.]